MSEVSKKLIISPTMDIFDAPQWPFLYGVKGPHIPPCMSPFMFNPAPLFSITQTIWGGKGCLWINVVFLGPKWPLLGQTLPFLAPPRDKTYNIQLKTGGQNIYTFASSGFVFVSFFSLELELGQPFFGHLTSFNFSSSHFEVWIQLIMDFSFFSS